MVESTKVSMGREELLHFAEHEIAFGGLNMDGISTILIAQLYQMHQRRTINIDNVTREIKALEGNRPPTRTKKESAFNKNTTLHGLYYKHFTDPRFLLKNLAAEFGYEKGGNRRLAELLGRLFHKYGSS